MIKNKTEVIVEELKKSNDVLLPTILGNYIDEIEENIGYNNNETDTNILMIMLNSLYEVKEALYEE
jgi:hypothetical protein